MYSASFPLSLGFQGTVISQGQAVKTPTTDCLVFSLSLGTELLSRGWLLPVPLTSVL